MILCSCNVLRDSDIREKLGGYDCRPSVGALFRKLGCEAKCGRCARNIVAVVDRYQGAAAPQCENSDGCPIYGADELAA